MLDNIKLDSSIFSSRIKAFEFAQGTLERFASDLKGVTFLNMKSKIMRETIFTLFREYVPEADLLEFRASIINRKFGACVLSFDQQRFGNELGLAIAMGLGNVLGQLRIHYESGDCFDRIEARHHDPCELTSRHSSPYKPERLHTDGHANPEKSDHFIILINAHEEYCEGGNSLLLHLDDWNEMPRFLKSPYAFTEVPFVASARGPISRNIFLKAGAQEGFDSFCASPFYHSNQGICLRFAEEYMHPQEVEQLNYITDLGQSVDKTPNIVRFKLRPGMILILNNMFWLHGRDQLKEHTGLHRLLRRIRGRFSSPVFSLGAGQVQYF